MSLTEYLTHNTVPEPLPNITTDEFLERLTATNNPDDHLAATIAYLENEDFEPIPVTETLFNTSPIAGWILGQIIDYDLLTGSALTTYKLIVATAARCDQLEQDPNTPPTITALNHHGLARLFVDEVTDPFTSLKHAAAYLTITEPHHWYAQDLRIAGVILYYVIEVGKGPIFPVALDLMKTWETRLANAITTADPDEAYSELSLLDIWQD